MECYGMGNWYGATGYGMMEFNGLGILFGSIVLVIFVLLLVLLIKELGR